MSNIILKGALENGDGAVELVVATDGSISAAPGTDNTNTAPSAAKTLDQTIDKVALAAALAGTGLTASAGKLNAAGGGGSSKVLFGGSVFNEQPGSGSATTTKTTNVLNTVAIGSGSDIADQNHGDGGVILGPGTLKNLRLGTDAANPFVNFNAVSATVYVNSTITTITVTGSGGTSYAIDSTHTVTVVDGDRVQISLHFSVDDQGGNPINYNIAASVEFDPS